MKIETRRLVIRSFSETDVEAFASIVSDPMVMRYIADGRTLTIEEAGVYIRSCLNSQEEFGYARYAVTRKETQELMGFCGYALINGEIDLGWRYATKWWNQGFGTEAASAVLDYGINMLKLPLIVGYAFTVNIASIRIMKKIDMNFDRYLTLFGKQAVRYITQ